MRARYASKCPACGGRVAVGESISRLASGKYGHSVCASPGFTRADAYTGVDPAEVRSDFAERRRMDADYATGYAEVAQIQAMSAPGSALREQMYLEMDLAAYNRGE